jgi:hypothetical protein
MADYDFRDSPEMAQLKQRARAIIRAWPPRVKHGGCEVGDGACYARPQMFIAAVQALRAANHAIETQRAREAIMPGPGKGARHP